MNHRSLLDIIVMEHIFATKHKTGVWIAKQELIDAFYGDFFRFSGCIGVDLQNKRGLVSFFKKIKQLLTEIEDLNIYIFPEGERNKQEQLLPFQAGAAKIAKANDLKIVPIYIDDRLERVFRAAPFSKKRKVHVYIGSTIHKPQELQERYEALVAAVQAQKDQGGSV